MNVVFLSPHFPPNYFPFCVRLKELGACVLGLADAPYDAFRAELRGALAGYYRVDDMGRYDGLVRALGHFTHRHGKIDRIDSLNEHWLETEAALRTDFNVFGLRNDTIGDVTRKSRMKEIYRRAGVAVARGGIARSLADGLEIAAAAGYPLVAKPDRGVGARATFEIRDRAGLERFFAGKPPVDYVLEEFVRGRIFSFDGLADRAGALVFWTAHEYSQGIMETVNADDHVSYWSLRDIPPDLEDAGRRTAAAFDVRERFFHFEFFRRERDGAVVALEVNMRPPGGLTTDMFNYANDIDIYREWASVVVRNRFEARWSRPYHCGYIGRKNGKRYARSHAEALAALGSLVVHHTPMESIFRDAIGDYGYLVRSPDLDAIRSAVRVVQELA